MASRDLLEITKSSHLVAYFCRTYSPGVLVEIGLAISRDIPVLAVTDREGLPTSQFLDALIECGMICIVPFDPKHSLETVIRKFINKKKPESR